MFVRPQGVLVRNTECKRNFCLFTIKLHRAPFNKYWKRGKTASLWLARNVLMDLTN